MLAFLPDYIVHACLPTCLPPWSQARERTAAVFVALIAATAAHRTAVILLLDHSFSSFIFLPFFFSDAVEMDTTNYNSYIADATASSIRALDDAQ
jgi:hypothetical protein